MGYPPQGSGNAAILAQLTVIQAQVAAIVLQTTAILAAVTAIGIQVTAIGVQTTAIQAALTARLDVAVSTRAAPGAAMALTPAERVTDQALILNDATPFPGADVALMKTQTDKIPNVEHTAPYSSGVQYDDISAVGPTNTTIVSITPVFPTGATKVRVIAVVDLFIMNDTANAQKITPVLAVQLNGGGYNNRWNPGAAVVAVPAVDGTYASIRAVVTITADVVTLQQTDFRWSITQTSANSVHYTSQATIFLVYHM